MKATVRSSIGQQYHTGLDVRECRQSSATTTWRFRMTGGDHERRTTREGCALVLSRFGVTESQVQVIVDSNIALDLD